VETCLQNPEVSIRGMGHGDPIESANVTHEEGNEGRKIVVKRRNRAFYGAKLLKRWEQLSAPQPSAFSHQPSIQAVILSGAKDLCI
jgi:hypothetical protein